MLYSLLRGCKMNHHTQVESVAKAQDNLRIEIPSWGFANTGTRFGKFIQPAAATSMEEKFADAAQINLLTGVTPTMGLHVEWDLPDGVASVPTIRTLEKKYGIRAGSINPNLFQAQEYKFGSICNPDPEVRRKALAHLLDCVEIARQLGSQDILPGFPMDQITRELRIYGSASAGWKRSSARCMRLYTPISGC